MLPILEGLKKRGITIYSTGGTQAFIAENNYEVETVESITDYPSILGGRVKTLHPKVFGGILARRELQNDLDQLVDFDIPQFDLVIVDLYPFEETVASTSEEPTIIEKIDIGGISLIRAAAKNFKDVVVIPSKEQYPALEILLEEQDGYTNLEDRKALAGLAFRVSSHYDTQIFNYFNQDDEPGAFRYSINNERKLRYGENPHQNGYYYGDINKDFDILGGKPLSYNNLVDIDSAVRIMQDFPAKENEVTFAILKHTNSCGLATRPNLITAWEAALAGDPVSAFGGILICNATVDAETAEEINKIFYEVVIAPAYSEEALKILLAKKKRIVLKQLATSFPSKMMKGILNGVIVQDADTETENIQSLKVVSKVDMNDDVKRDLVFASKAVKHLKSNGIALVKNNQIVGIGTGQTSRVDALRQAIEKAKHFNFDLNGAVMASDAFFPFPDCVEIAHKAGITAVVQPGGSIKDQNSIDYCDNNEIAMAFTGIRHFKH